MATITSVGSGLWSAAGTWDAGVPVDNDVVVVAAGHVVEFDVDQSGFANGIDGLTITGTLKLTRTAGTYYLKIKAAKTINGAGTFDCGTAISPIPTGTNHTITGGTNWYIQGSGGMTMTVYAAEPTYKYVLLTGNEAIGQTVLEVDTDVTGDIWADGDEVALGTQSRIIASGGIAAGSITITVSLTAQVLKDYPVTLISRNVRITGNGANVHNNFTAGKLTIAGGLYSGSGYPFDYCNGMIFSGGIVNGAVIGIYRSHYITVSGGAFCRCSSSLNGCNNSRIDDGFFTGGNAINDCSGSSVYGGTFIACNYAMLKCPNSSVYGGTFKTGMIACISDCKAISIYGGYFQTSTYGIWVSTAKITNAVFSGNNCDIRECTFTAFNVSMLSGTEVSNPVSTDSNFSESIDHDKVQGAYRFYTSGGNSVKQAVTIPAGYSSSIKTTFVSATSVGYWQKEITIGAGASVNITMNLRKDASMAYLPRVIVFNKASVDPFAGGAGLHTFTMTNSIDTWEDDLYTYTNTTSEDVTLVIRCQGMNATGNMYSALLVEQINVDLTSAIAKIDVIDGLVDAIKAKTDQLAFTVANQVDANALTGGGGASAADVRAEMDANSTQLAGIKAKTDNLPTDPADQSLLAGLIGGLPSSADVITALKAAVFDGTLTFEDSVKLYNAILIGKLYGGGTGTLKFRDPADTKDRITATVDLSNGDRDSITLDLS